MKKIFTVACIAALSILTTSLLAQSQDEMQKWTDYMTPRFQEIKHTGTFNGMPFEGYGLVGYDNARKVFQSTWIDNMGSGIMNLEGTYDEASKTVSLKGKSTDPMTGAQVDVRETFQIIDDNTQLMEMYIMQGGQEFKTLSMKITRKM
jgi:hypothetical protein